MSKSVLIFKTDFGSPAKSTIALRYAKGDTFVKAPSSNRIDDK